MISLMMSKPNLILRGEKGLRCIYHNVYHNRVLFEVEDVNSNGSTRMQNECKGKKQKFHNLSRNNVSGNREIDIKLPLSFSR